MKRHSNLHLLSATCRLAPGNEDTDGAARQWEDVFGVKRGTSKGQNEFVNAKLKFIPGMQGERDGLVEICIGVEGNVAWSNVLGRADRAGVLGNDGIVDMVGVRWKFVLLEGGEKSKL
jgi:hypothetical protein